MTEQAKPWAHKIKRYPVVDSTMLVAQKLAQEGAEHGTCVWANAQTHGIGRKSRVWQSDAAAGVYMTLILRPQHPVATFSVLPLVFGYAVCRALTKSFPSDLSAQALSPLGLKWPNDVVYLERKLAGILLQAFALETQEPYVLVGMGVNIAHADSLRLTPELCQRYIGWLDILAAGFRSGQKSAQSLDAKWWLTQIGQQVVQEAQAAYAIWDTQGFAPVAQAFAALDRLRGRWVQVEIDNKRYVGQALGLSPQGQLRVQCQSGIQYVHSGEVAWAPTDVTGQYLGLSEEKPCS